MIGVTRKLRCHSSSSGVYEGSSADRVGMKRNGLNALTIALL